MIKIIDKFSKNNVFFPKTLRDMDFPINLILKNGKNNRYIKVINEDVGYYKNFYCFNLSFEDIPDGEYTYILSDNEIKEDGIIRIGIVTSNPKEKNNEIKLKQYGE